MADFSSWSTLRDSLRNQIANNPEALLTGEYRVEGKSYRFRSLQEVMNFLDWIDQQIALSEGQEGNEATAVFV